MKTKSKPLPFRLIRHLTPLERAALFAEDITAYPHTPLAIPALRYCDFLDGDGVLTPSGELARLEAAHAAIQKIAATERIESGKFWARLDS